MFYREVVQAVLLLMSETWVMSPCIGRMLVGFHYRVIQRLTRGKPIQQADGNWVYPPLVSVVVEECFEVVDTCVA